jgi:hypothetical protein
MADVAFGSFESISRCLQHVCTAPNSDRIADILKPTLVPKAAMSTSSKNCSYSIISSAVDSNLSETVRPSALAVLRLSTNSN